MKFTYRSGQRPLDGFTIKRGVGQGGFGEVYFAVSDAGKEVALKLLHRAPDAELRGIAHCLNLKHPNLVHLFDLRTDDRGDRWVVMEYVFGESLAQWINRYPTGLPVNLAAEWFAALCRGVGYLHDQGVVHRDLKPANVFIENGHLKVGDYGLARRVSASQGGEVTRGVGTPNYMAPEIKNGNYTQSVDVYALGVILYEMLTGHPPFDGETPGEVMMKHLTDPPDLSRAPAAFRAVLERALDKNPATRFGSVREFARAVEAIGTPNAGPKVAEPIPIAVEVLEIPPPVATVAPPRQPPAGLVNGAPADRPKYASGPIPLTYRGRLTELARAFPLVPVVAGLCTAPLVLVGSAEPWSLLGRVFVLATALSWAVLVAARPLPPESRTTWGRRGHLLLAGMAVGLLAFWLDGWAIPRGGTPADSNRDLVLWDVARVSPETFSTAMRYLFYFGLTTAAARWWALTNPRRKERFRFLPLFTAGLWSAAFLFLWPWEFASAALGVAPVVIAAVCVQVASPWVPAPATPVRPVARPVSRRGQYKYAGYALLFALGVVLFGCEAKVQRTAEGGATNRRAQDARKQAESYALDAVKGAANAEVAVHPELRKKSFWERMTGGGTVVTVSATVPPTPPRSVTPVTKVTPRNDPPAVRTAARDPRRIVVSERVTSAIAYPTEAEADEGFLKDAQDWIERKLRELDPPVSYRPSPVSVADFIRRDSRSFRSPTDQEAKLLQENGYSRDRVYAEYVIEVTADQVRAMRTRERLAGGLKGIGVMTAVALAGFLFLRLDEWSKGYLTSWLALGAAALAGGVAAAVLFV